MTCNIKLDAISSYHQVIQNTAISIKNMLLQTNLKTMRILVIRIFLSTNILGSFFKHLYICQFNFFTLIGTSIIAFKKVK